MSRHPAASNYTLALMPFPDDPITIRKMRTDPYEAASYVNCLFMSNTFTPVKPSAKDRRYNIAERQDKRTQDEAA